MTDLPVDDPLRRIAKSERIAALDVLRGIAILFILVMNIPGMGGYFSVEPFDPRLVSWTDADRITFLAIGDTMEGAQRGLLEILFGAGVMIMARKGMTPDAPISVADLHFRRNLWLVAFGLIHAFVLLWPGDILFAYGIAALFVFPFRKLPPTAKAIVGAVFILAAVSPGVGRYIERAELKADVAAAQASAKAGKPATKAGTEALETWKEKQDGYLPLAQNKKKQEAVAEEKKARLGSFGAYYGFLAKGWAQFNVGPFMYFSFFEIFGTMLLGMALYQWGIVQGRASAATYAAITVVGYGVGVTLRHIGGVENLQFRMDPKFAWLTWDIGRIALVMGHIALVNLALKTAPGGRILSIFQAPGRMPLTVYFSASVIGMWILFPGIGLGLFGRYGFYDLTVIALTIIAGQVVFANVWMAAFESGPVDWVWKSLVYGKPQPFRKKSGAQGALAAAE